MIKILHTADWQLGLKLRYFDDPDKAAQARARRYEGVREIGRLATAEEVDIVLVAGDVFDDNTLGGTDIEQAIDALDTFPDVPVILLPGNHDSASPGGILERLRDRLARGNAAKIPQIHICLDREVLTLLDGRIDIHPCPLFRRHERDDPTAHLPERQPGDPIRVVVAHGGVLNFGGEGDDSEVANLIDAERILEKGFDFIALGDWHSPFTQGPRVWYSGTHEATRFKEKEPGQVLIVEIDGPQATPRAELRSVAQTHWVGHTQRLNDQEDVDTLRDWFHALPERSRTLVRIVLEGSLGLEAYTDLERLLEEERESLLYLRVKDAQLVVRPSDEDIRSMSVEGFVGQAVTELNREDTTVNRDALRLLHRFLAEVQA